MLPSGSFSHTLLNSPIRCTSPSRAVSGRSSYRSNATPFVLRSSTIASKSSPTAHDAAVALFVPAYSDG